MQTNDTSKNFNRKKEERSSMQFSNLQENREDNFSQVSARPNINNSTQQIMTKYKKVKRAFKPPMSTTAAKILKKQERSNLQDNILQIYLTTK